MEELRIGVFVCHCGLNIAGFLDVEEVAEYAATLPDVVFVQRNLFTCSEAGLREIEKAIKEQNLNRVVVAACTPRTHEPLFRATCAQAGLNRFLFEFVNIRDQCSWVHQKEPEKATQKAKDLVRMGVARARFLEPLEEMEVEVDRRAVVIGGGISGLTSALSLAERGFEVKLIEKEKELGGLLRQINLLYPGHEQASELIGQKIEAARKNKRIEVLTSAQVSSVEGFIGNYKVHVQNGRGKREFDCGVIIVATGAQVFEPKGLYNYDGKRVITQLQLEKLLSTPNSKLRTPNSVVMIQCVGARQEGRPYCSRICCTVAIKNALLLKEQNPSAKICILHRGIQTYDAEFEDYYSRARAAEIRFIRYSPDEPPEVEKGLVRVADLLFGEELELEADLVVLSTPLIPNPDVDQLVKTLRVPIDENGFFLEAHVKLSPLDFATDGIYLCGSAHWPCHVGEAVFQAQGAASRASIPLTNGYVRAQPIISSLEDEESCRGCGVCASLCPYHAIEIVETPDGKKARTIEAACKGCGVCGSSCYRRAIKMNHFTDEQISAQIKALLKP